MWSDAEILLLKATSMEVALAAKLELLSREFALIQTKARDIPFWREILESQHVSIRDWIWLDALFRSRSFDLPLSGESMVPCLDLANHSAESTAYFHQDVVTHTTTLLLRDGCSLSPGAEVTISYGKDKPAAEMLFNYGFIDADSTAQNLVIPLDTLLENEADPDPSLAYKLHVFSAVPILELKIDNGGKVRWTAPFMYLLCTREQDGLTFEVKEKRGEKFLRMLWRGADITNMAGMLGILINAHELRQVVQFRAVSLLLDVVDRQLQGMRAEEQRIESARGDVCGSVLQAVLQLRSIEANILERSEKALKEERDQLLKDESVKAYLASS